MLLDVLTSSVDSGLQPTPSSKYTVSVDELSILIGHSSTLLHRLGKFIISSCISAQSSRSICGMQTMEREVCFRFYLKGEWWYSSSGLSITIPILSLVEGLPISPGSFDSLQIVRTSRTCPSMCLTRLPSSQLLQARKQFASCSQVAQAWKHSSSPSPQTEHHRSSTLQVSSGSNTSLIFFMVRMLCLGRGQLRCSIRLLSLCPWVCENLLSQKHPAHTAKSQHISQQQQSSLSLGQRQLRQSTLLLSESRELLGGFRGQRGARVGSLVRMILSKRVARGWVLAMNSDPSHSQQSGREQAIGERLRSPQHLKHLNCAQGLLKELASSSMLTYSSRQFSVQKWFRGLVLKLAMAG